MGRHHYNLGLFCKTRGLFREGMLANQVAAGLVDEPVDSYEWNLGICATGAGEGSVALDVWQRMEQKIEMGRFAFGQGIAFDQGISRTFDRAGNTELA